MGATPRMSPTPRSNASVRRDAVPRRVRTATSTGTVHSQPTRLPRVTGGATPRVNPYERGRAAARVTHMASVPGARSGARTSRPSRGTFGGGGLSFVAIAVAVVLAVVAIAVFMWTNRSVAVTVDGSTAQVKVGSTLDRVVSEAHVSVKGGDLVSVGGKVLTSGGGDAFSASVSGHDLDGDELSSYRIAGGEDLVFGDGANVTEPFSATTATIAPKLTMSGSAGAIAFISQWGYAGTSETRTGKTSGETATVVTRAAQDCVVTLLNVKPEGDQKLVALTFDDGPSKYTEQYLAILKEHGAVATFFNLGQSVDATPALSKAIVDAGSQVASHTYSHDQLTKDTAEKVYSELTTSFASIAKQTGVATSVIRPPYGDFKERQWLESKGVLSASVIWNLDSEDWRLPGADSIVSKATKGATSGSIILMHDGGGNRDQDLQALPTIIDTLHDQGFTFVTVDQLMASDSRIPQEIATGSATMPSDATWPTEIA